MQPKYITNIYLKFSHPVPQLGHSQQKNRPTLSFFIIKKIFIILSSIQYSRGVNAAVCTLKNKGATKGSSRDAIEEPVLVPQRTIQSKVL